MKQFFKSKIEMVRQKFLLLFNYIQKKISEINKDKLLHFFCGSVLVGLFDLFLPHAIITLVAVAVIAATKEIYDEMERDSPMDFVDFIFTILPALINFI